MPTHASHTSTRTLAATTVAYLFFALPFIFAPVRSMKLLGCRAASIEDLTDMNTHALCLLIMARGVAYFLAAVPIAAATRGADHETCGAANLAVVLTMSMDVLDNMLREIPLARRAGYGVFALHACAGLGVVMLAANLLAFRATKLAVRSLARNPFNPHVLSFKGTTGSRRQHAALLVVGLVAIVFGAFAYAPRASRTLQTSEISMFASAVRIEAESTMRAVGLQLVFSGLLMLVILAQRHDYSLWVTARYAAFAIGALLPLMAAAKAFVSALGLAGAAHAARQAIAALGALFVLCAGAVAAGGDAPPPRLRKREASFVPASSMILRRAASEGKPAASPPVSPLHEGVRESTRAGTRAGEAAAPYRRPTRAG